MAIAVDGSSPIRYTGNPTGTTAITSAAFTAPTDALIVLCGNADSSGAEGFTLNAADSGGLTWTKWVERTAAEATAGAASAIFTARTTSSVSRTVDFSRSATSTSGRRLSARVYVLTGVDVNGTPVDTAGANNEGGSATNNLTTSSVTPGAAGLLIAVSTEWNALGSFEASSDLTQDTTTYPGEVSVCSGYKVSASGVGVTANLNAAGSSAAQHKWCQITVREAAGGGGGTIGGPCFDGRTFRGLTFGRVLSAPMSRGARMMAEADRLWRRDRQLRRAA